MRWGCLYAYIDFLLGWMLHDSVLSSSTLTQRTMYDYGFSQRPNGHSSRSV